MWDLSCETVREQLTNSIRKQWRILKSHVEKLDNQGNFCLNAFQVGSDAQWTLHFQLLGKPRYGLRLEVLLAQGGGLKSKSLRPPRCEVWTSLRRCTLLTECLSLKRGLVYPSALSTVYGWIKQTKPLLNLGNQEILIIMWYKYKLFAYS